MLVKHIRKIIHAVGVLSLTFLSACYVSDVEIIAKGEFAPIVGTYSCKGMDKSKIHTFSETVSGSWLAKSYGYTDSHYPDESMRFVKISDNLYLSQIRLDSAKASERGYLFEFSYIYFLSKSHFVVMVANIVEYEAILENKAANHEVKLEPHSVMTLTLSKLKGRSSDILSFLVSHEIGNLTEFMNCHRIL